MAPSVFERVELAPRDPILGLNEAFAADPRQRKVNLGVGVYYDEGGKIPLLRAVREAERALAESPTPRGYLPIEGIAAYDAAVQQLLFGADSPVLMSGRLVTAQALGGTGALKIGADFLKRILPDALVLISDPSWENHRALFETAGFAVSTYPYYDSAKRGLDFGGMKAALAAAEPGSIVVLHACCHNPTGVDLDRAQWADVVRIAADRRLVPFLDIAYQGFGEGIDADAAAVRLFAEAGMPFFIASSFSKSFSLYGERVGALTIVTEDMEQAARVLSQVKRTIRTNYSNPPTHGGAVVAAVLADRKLRAMWEDELGAMRERIKSLRQQLVDGLNRHGARGDFSFILRQRGMFSYTGLTAQQVERLREQFGIYAVSSGRICVAALNANNLEYVCASVAAVLKN
ncbi:MAG TPA: amino acid aminotransferase [Burkholderiaceae bacterium]|jgi:aromatic-amino-acid transaminase|nr:amino acid aminotransferase [Burkholderiaceae bacterium]